MFQPAKKVIAMTRLRRVVVVGAMLLLVGCSASKGQNLAPTQAAVTPTPVAMTSSPMPTASPSPLGWITYNEPAWGYSINMPADWHLISAGELDPEQFKLFSFEDVTNAETLAGLDSDGLALRVIVSQLNSGCPGVRPPVGWSGSTVPAVAVDVDGYTSVVTGYEAQDKSVWGLQAEASSGKYCYSFVGLTLNHDAQLKWTPLFEQMLSTFSFGTPIAPPF